MVRRLAASSHWEFACETAMVACAKGSRTTHHRDLEQRRQPCNRFRAFIGSLHMRIVQHDRQAQLKEWKLVGGWYGW